LKFLIDAQLPKRAVRWLTNAGCDALHTLTLPNGNRTVDANITDIADEQSRIVVTKDADFVDSHMLNGRASKLLLISTGNITNTELEALFVPLIPQIEREFRTNSFIELGPSGIIVRG
jgi:predicted nuclease of predicted toxin-antitoxin system